MSTSISKRLAEGMPFTLLIRAVLLSTGLLESLVRRQPGTLPGSTSNL